MGERKHFDLVIDIQETQSKRSVLRVMTAVRLGYYIRQVIRGSLVRDGYYVMSITGNT